MPLPVLSASSLAHTNPEDALKAVISLQEQKEHASILQRSKLRSVVKRAKALGRVAELESDAEREGYEDLLKQAAASNSISQRRPKSQKVKRVGGDGKAEGFGDRKIASINPLLKAGGTQGEDVGVHPAPTAAASGVSPLGSAQNATPSLVSSHEGQTPSGETASVDRSGTIMVMLSTTQAIIFMVAALSAAAFIGAFLLWFTLAFDLYGYFIDWVYLAPPIGQQLFIAYSQIRREIYHEVEILLDAMIIELEILRDSAILAQGSGDM